MVLGRHEWRRLQPWAPALAEARALTRNRGRNAVRWYGARRRTWLVHALRQAQGEPVEWARLARRCATVRVTPFVLLRGRERWLGLGNGSDEGLGWRTKTGRAGLVGVRGWRIPLERVRRAGGRGRGSLVGVRRCASPRSRFCAAEPQIRVGATAAMSDWLVTEAVRAELVGVRAWLPPFDKLKASGWECYLARGGALLRRRGLAGKCQRTPYFHDLQV